MISTPRRAAAVMPLTTATGVEITSAHGHAITSSVSPRTSQVMKSAPASVGTATTSTAATVIAGVYQRAKRVTTRSVFAFSAPARSTSSTMRASELESAGFSVRMCMKPSRVMVPAKTGSPGSFSTGSDSPVSGDSSTAEPPSTTLPSTGMRSPGRTTTTSPTTTSEARTVSSTPPRSTTAVLGARSISDSIDARARSTA